MTEAIWWGGMLGSPHCGAGVLQPLNCGGRKVGWVGEGRTGAGADACSNNPVSHLCWASLGGISDSVPAGVCVCVSAAAAACSFEVQPLASHPSLSLSSSAWPVIHGLPRQCFLKVP